MPKSIDLLELRDTNQAEAYIVVAIVRGIVVAICYPAVLGIVVPATAPIHTVRAHQPASNANNMVRLNDFAFACCAKAIKGSAWFAKFFCDQSPSSTL